ncbi:cysteine--tRNA ligase [Patescibacteria group bacterium]
MLKLYNTLTRKKEEFKPIKSGQASIYACGPTVYWFAHIGNHRTNIFVDVLNRVLDHNGFDVTLIMNITDVGHLTDDGNDGEDKMIIAMKREGKTAYDIAEFYTRAFFEDLEVLNIRSAQEYPRATDHIQEQVDMVRKLEENGFTYETSDGVYFDTSKLDNYGRLSGQKGEDKQAGARVDMGEKKNPTDFALWKFSPKDSQREMEWDSPWGTGFPGWHLECSAMSKKYLGVPFDIHTGGIDHIPVHHENELAQTQGTDGVLQANMWMHGDFLQVDGGKMSKSLGNLYTIQNLIEKDYDPLDYRYFTFGAHYRTKINFTFEALDAAHNALNNLRDLVRDWDKPAEQGSAEHEKEFFAAANDDLDLPKAVSIVWKMVDDKELPSAAKSNSLLKFDEILGLRLDRYVAKPLNIPKEVTALVVEREAARAAQEWDKSDRLRDDISAFGFIVEDTDNGPKLREMR